MIKLAKKKSFISEVKEIIRMILDFCEEHPIFVFFMFSALVNGIVSIAK